MMVQQSQQCLSFTPREVKTCPAVKWEKSSASTWFCKSAKLNILGWIKYTVKETNIVLMGLPILTPQSLRKAAC